MGCLHKGMLPGDSILPYVLLARLGNESNGACLNYQSQRLCLVQVESLQGCDTLQL